MEAMQDNNGSFTLRHLAIGLWYCVLVITQKDPQQ
jgi:hypothetical protein